MNYDTVWFLEQATSEFMSPELNSPHLNPMAYTIGGIISSMSTTTSCVFKMSMNSRSVCWSFGRDDSAVVTTGTLYKVV